MVVIIKLREETPSISAFWSARILDNSIKHSTISLPASTNRHTVKAGKSGESNPSHSLPRDLVQVDGGEPKQKLTGFARVKNFINSVTPDITIAATGTTLMSFGLSGLSVASKSSIGRLAASFSPMAGKILGLVSGPTASVVPYVAGVAAGLNMLKGARQLFMGKGIHDKINGVLDVGLSVACTASMMPPLVPAGLVATGVIGTARIISGLMKKSQKA